MNKIVDLSLSIDNGGDAQEKTDFDTDYYRISSKTIVEFGINTSVVLNNKVSLANIKDEISGSKYEFKLVNSIHPEQIINIDPVGEMVNNKFTIKRYTDSYILVMIEDVVLPCPYITLPPIKKILLTEIVSGVPQKVFEIDNIVWRNVVSGIRKLVMRVYPHYFKSTVNDFKISWEDVFGNVKVDNNLYSLTV